MKSEKVEINPERYLFFLLVCVCAAEASQRVMTQDERWNIRYSEVVEFIATNHRNPSKYNMEKRNIYNYIKHIRKQLNQGLLKEDRIDAFEKLMALMEHYKRKNQWV